MKSGTCLSLCDIDPCGTGQSCNHTNIAACQFNPHDGYYKRDNSMQKLYDRSCYDDTASTPFAPWKIAVIVICALLLIVLITLGVYFYKRRSGGMNISRYENPQATRPVGPSEHGTITLYA